MAKMIDKAQALEFADTFFGDPILKMATKAALNNCPEVEAEPVVHGRWEQSESMALSAKCSKCKGWVTKHSINEPDFNYCPNCGAKMDGDGNG